MVVAKALKEAGLDYVDVSSGGISTGESRCRSDPGYNVPIAEQSPSRNRHCHARRRHDRQAPKQAEAIVAEGQADMVALARGFLDDPHWGWHAAQALGGEVTRPPQYHRVSPVLWPAPALRA